MSKWKQISALPPEVQDAARRQLEERAGPLPERAGPSKPWCPHPRNARQRFGDSVEVEWCPFCGRDEGDQALGLRSFIERSGRTWTVPELLEILGDVDKPRLNRLLARLFAAGFIVRAYRAKEME